MTKTAKNKVQAPFAVQTNREIFGAKCQARESTSETFDTMQNRRSMSGFRTSRRPQSHATKRECWHLWFRSLPLQKLETECHIWRLRVRLKSSGSIQLYFRGKWSGLPATNSCRLQ